MTLQRNVPAGCTNPRDSQLMFGSVFPFKNTKLDTKIYNFMLTYYLLIRIPDLRLLLLGLLFNPLSSFSIFFRMLLAFV